MKKLLIIPFLLFGFVSFSQKKAVKKIQIQNHAVNIYTAGLDNLILENSNSKFVEIYLYAEEYDDQLIEVSKSLKEININFKFKGTQSREIVFRKFITKRLQRASAIIKVPKTKKVIVFGENVDIQTKSHQNNLDIYIDNGIVKLDTIKANTLLKFYSGNAYAFLNNTSIDVKSNIGKIKVNDILKKVELKKTVFNPKGTLKISSIKGNIFLKN
jgi:hypothetical protein